MQRPLQSCDIFCRVIDNFGDAAVCWRLARQLADEHSLRIRLFIDVPERLAALSPDLSDLALSVHPWADSAHLGATGDVVVEAFACELPGSVITLMRQQTTPPVWINLDYLSAEAWVETAHGLPSIQPTSGLKKYFFFPGFTPKTGGVLRERDYAYRQAHFDRSAFSREFGIELLTGERLLSLFCYPSAPIKHLAAALAQSTQPIRLLIPGGEPKITSQGALTVQTLPFLPQHRYDELLWLCDANFVRGEDSFVRAQLAGKPLIWQLYKQADDVHLEKMAAFLDRYLQCAPASAESKLVIDSLWRAWNTSDEFDWNRVSNQWDELARLATIWQKQLFQQDDLASQLVRFCTDRAHL